MSEELLEGDPKSLLIDGLPDLSKCLFIHSSIDDAGLDPYEFRVFCHLRRRAREFDNCAYPGMRSISKVTGISLGKVCAAISSLQKKEFLKVVHFGDGQRNLYFVSLPAERAGVHRMNARSPHERSVHVMNGSVHHMNGSVHHMNERISIEGNPLEGNPLKGVRSSSCSVSQNNNKTSHCHGAPDGDLFGQSKARPDSFETLLRYCQSLSLTWDDATYLWGNWQENGFRRGKYKIRDWKQCVRTLAAGGYLPSCKKGYKPSPMQETYYQQLNQADLEAEARESQKIAEEWEANATPADREWKANFLRMKSEEPPK